MGQTLPVSSILRDMEVTAGLIHRSNNGGRLSCLGAVAFSVRGSFAARDRLWKSPTLARSATSIHALNAEER